MMETSLGSLTAQFFCKAGKNGTELIAEALTCLIIGNMQVRESLQPVDLQGSVLNESFGLVAILLSV
jgi:hypothetical protein